jgi:hypothetical protein
MSYWTVMYPSDTVKSAMQTKQMRPVPSPTVSIDSATPVNTSNAALSSRPTFSGTLAQIYSARGIRGLYAGLLPTLLRAAPSNAAVFLVYEHMMQLMANWS